MKDINNATREVFGNIAPWMRVVFFIMIAASIAVLVWQVVSRAWLWQKGRRGGFEGDWRGWGERGGGFVGGRRGGAKKKKGARVDPSPPSGGCCVGDVHHPI